MNEFEIINKFFSKLSNKVPGSLNLNDDVYFDKEKKLVVSVDSYVEGIHFFDFKNPHLVIKKILRSSISDLLCKGVFPKHYLISASGSKKNFSISNLRKISKSLTEEQNKYNIHLVGGDTVFSKKLSFSITTIGYSTNIVFRNNSKVNDDIYVTGNLGDSFLGLLSLQNKINLSKNLRKYFINSYFKPKINFFLTNKGKSFANSSIDVSDGLFADLEKMINKQKLSFKIYLRQIPVSNKLSYLIKSKKFLKQNVISRGDDYQILFTASKAKRKYIRDIAKKNNQKITIIGKIIKNKVKSSIIGDDYRPIYLNNKGYIHKF